MLDRDLHHVDRVDRADDAGPVERALAVLDAGGLEVGHDGEVLPHLALEARLGELLAQDRVALAHRLEAVARDRAGAAHAEAGAGERLAVDHRGGEAERAADLADLVLEEDLDGLDELEARRDVRRQAAGVVVRLDAGLALEDVRPDRALREERDAVEFAGLLGEDVDELLADDVALLLGVGDAGELVEEAVDGVDVDQVCGHLVAEDLDDLLWLSFAEESVVDVYADELLADGLDEKGRDDGGVDAAGKGEEDFLVAYLRAELLELLVDEGLGEFGRVDAGHVVWTRECHGNLLSAELSMKRRRPFH